jgi:acetylornithine deacetylase/succinyl-diaminopimelate desuccinylase-like protein
VCAATHKITGMDSFVNDVDDAVSKYMPLWLEDLSQLVRIPSVSWESFDQTFVHKSADAVVALFSRIDFFDSISVQRSRKDDSDGLGNPAVLARREPRNGAPTVLLYAHHDVQPPGDSGEWNTQPFEPTLVGERLFGRGTADDKAGIVSHFASLQILHELSDSVDLGVVLFIEGEEEAGSPSFGNFLRDHASALDSDVIIVADSGNFTESTPALTVSLRGNVTLNLTVSTLDHAVHSGMFGGVVPDAFMALSLLVASFFDENGSVAIDGVTRFEMTTPTYSEKNLREESGLLPGVEPIGTGAHLHRIWSQPSITVTGTDMPTIGNASNTLIPSVTVRLSMRVAPGQLAEDAAAALVAHIHKSAPFGAAIAVSDVSTGEGYLADVTGWAANHMREAMNNAWKVPPIDIGVGGSIPFIAQFTDKFPTAQVLVTGVEDPDSRAHSPNESLHLGAFAHAIAAQTLFLLELNSAKAAK